jgi:hypothetical protein
MPFMDPTWQNASQPAAAGIMEACAAMFREAISYTELEFQTASAAGLPRLVFLLDNAASLPEGCADGTRGPVEGLW